MPTNLIPEITPEVRERIEADEEVQRFVRALKSRVTALAETRGSLDTITAQVMEQNDYFRRALIRIEWVPMVLPDASVAQCCPFCQAQNPGPHKAVCPMPWVIGANPRSLPPTDSMIDTPVGTEDPAP